MNTRERHINVERSERSVIEDEFDSMRGRFDAEMRRVEEEMQRLRREFESYTPRMHPAHPQIQHQPPPSVQAITAAPVSAPAFSQSSPHTAMVPAAHHPHRRRYDPYLDSIRSPLIRDESDGKSLRLRFNVNQYLPEEVTVRTVDNRLLVHAKHEEKAPGKTVYREYNQEFMLPRGTIPEAISSSLSRDGILTVEAPLPHMIENGSSPNRHAITHH